MHGRNPINEKPTAEKMHAWMAEQNVVGMAAVQKGLIYGTDNSYIVDAADLFPEEMRAIIIVDPQAAETPHLTAFVGRGARLAPPGRATGAGRGAIRLI